MAVNVNKSLEYPDHVAAATAGIRCRTAPETRWSTLGAEVRVYAGRSRPRVNGRATHEEVARKWQYPGICGTRVRKPQSSQVNGRASGRDDIGPELLQRHGVTGLGGPDG